jgi:outer membrane protein assembly factor BamB
MSDVTKPHLSKKHFLYPAILLVVGTTIFLAAQFWPNSDVSPSTLSLVKMGTVIGLGVLLLLWALRMPEWRKRNVWLTTLLCGGLLLTVFKPSSMNGSFFPIFVVREWVENAFLGGSHDALLAKQRAEQGRAEGGADLTITPVDMPEFRGKKRDGLVVGPRLERDWKANPPRELWRQLIGGGYAGFVSANGFLVTIEQRRDDEVVVCYEAKSGREVWATGWPTRFSETLGGVGPRATPTIAHGNVFAYGANGRLVCLNGKDGKEIWSAETLANNANISWAMSGAPLVVGDLVVVNPGSQTPESAGRAVLAYDCATGKERWATGDKRSSYASPQLAKLHGVDQILIFDGHGLAGYSLDGKQLWRTPWTTTPDINVAQPVVIDEQTICIGSGYGHGGAQIRISKEGDSWSAKEVWKSKNTVMRWKFSSAVRRGDFMYGLNEGLLECVEIKTGKPLWKDERRIGKGDGFGYGQILLSDDLIVALTDKGELVLVEATSEKFNELGRVQALTKGPKTWNTPALVEGIVYVRNEEEMAAFDLRAK